MEKTAAEIAQEWADKIRNEGYKLTSPRMAVINVMASSQRALNATQIFDLSREHYPQLGLVSIYRTLEILEDLDIIQRVHQQDGCHTYIAGFQGHQHLLICEGCGRAQFFEGDDLEILFKRVAEESGYSISDHWLQLSGLCPDCRKTTG